MFIQRETLFDMVGAVSKGMEELSMAMLWLASYTFFLRAPKRRSTHVQRRSWLATTAPLTELWWRTNWKTDEKGPLAEWAIPCLG